MSRTPFTFCLLFFVLLLRASFPLFGTHYPSKTVQFFNAFFCHAYTVWSIPPCVWDYVSYYVIPIIYWGTYSKIILFPSIKHWTHFFLPDNYTIVLNNMDHCTITFRRRRDANRNSIQNQKQSVHLVPIWFY